MTCHKPYTIDEQNILCKVPDAYQNESELSLLRTYDKKDKQKLLSSVLAWLLVATSKKPSLEPKKELSNIDKPSISTSI